MRKTIAITALVAACMPMLAMSPARAHTPSLTIAGFQYFFTVDEIPPEGGTTGYVNTPAGPVAVGDAFGTSEEDGLGDITNRDPILHTFTECTGACDTAAGTSVDAAFDVSVAAGATVALPQLPAGDYLFMCTVHKWMRGSLQVG